MTDTEIILARARVRGALTEAGIDEAAALALARGFDPEAVDARQYLGRVLDSVERALDSVCAVTACARIGGAR